MQLISKLAVAAATVAIVATGATTASAYSISGGAYAATATASPAFTAGGGAYTLSCSTHTATGSATGSATTALTPWYDRCTFFGFPVIVTQSGAWNLTVTADSGGVFSAELEIPAGTSTTMSIPIMGCTTTVAGPQTLSGVQMLNYALGVNLSATVTGIEYTATGCPMGDGTDGTYSTGWNPITIPGITVS